MRSLKAAVSYALVCVLVLCAASRVAYCQYAAAYGPGARATAMGGAYIAAANDASAIAWNPALLTNFDEPQLLQANNFIEGDGYSGRSLFGAIALRVGNAGTLGASVGDFSLKPDNDPWNSGIRGQTWTVGFAHRFGRLSLGISLNRTKADYPEPYGYEEEEYVCNYVDVGFAYQPNPATCWAVRVRDAASDPRRRAIFDVGFAREFHTQALGKVTVACSLFDVTKSQPRFIPWDWKDHTSVGVEARPTDKVALRLGILEACYPSGGLGYKIGSGSVDVAWGQSTYGDEQFVVSGSINF